MALRTFLSLAFLSAIAIVITPEAAAQTSTITINFDDQPGGIPPVATNGTFNPFATFSTEAGSTLLIFGGAGTVGTSPPHVLTAAVNPNTGPYDSDIFVDFTNPVQDLSFNVTSDNEAGAVASLNVFVNGSLASTLAVAGNGVFTDPIAIDLSSFANVTRLEIVNITDVFGLSYDDFVFTAPIPEPATFVLLAAGLVTVGVFGYRRRKN